MELKTVEVLGTSGVTAFRAQIRSLAICLADSGGPHYIVWRETNTVCFWQCPRSPVLWVLLCSAFSVY